MACRVLLADDHLIVRESLRYVLIQEGYEVVGGVSDGREAVNLAGKLRPDVAVMDFSMPLLNGIDAARAIRSVSPRTRIILLTMYKDDRCVLDALRAGVKGYVLKTQPTADLIQAIQTIMEGATYLSPAISDSVVKAALAGEPAADPLTQREREILQLIAEGKTNKEICRQLAISVKTVESHRRNVMVKLDVHETAGLVRHAIKIGLIQP